MYLTKILVFGLLTSYSFANTPLLQGNCSDIITSVSISEEPVGSRAVVKCEGGQAPYKYVFYKPSGDLISEDFNNNAITGLAKGKYFCTVIDKNNCKKTIDIEIK